MPKRFRKNDVTCCVSCGEPWPCPTENDGLRDALRRVLPLVAEATEIIREALGDAEDWTKVGSDDLCGEHAREGIEWLRKLSTMQSRSDLTEKFDRMARAVEALLAEHEETK